VNRHVISVGMVGWLLLGAISMAAAQEPQGAPSPPADEPAAPARPESPGAGGEEPLAQEAVAPPESQGVPGLVTVDFKDADIRQVLRVISLKSGVDIVAAPDVEGIVSIKLTNVPWEQALDVILRTYGFSYARDGNIIRVLTREAVEQEELGTEVFALNYSTAEDVTPIIKELLSDRGRVKFDARTNTVVVTDLPATLFQIRKVITRLDQQTPQVHIDTKIVETKRTKDENFGIDWFDSTQLTLSPATAPTTFPFPGGADLGNVGSTFFPRPGAFSPSTGAVLSKGRVPETGGTFTFGTLTANSLSTTINFLKQKVNTNIISHPTVVVLNNREAFVQVGDDINIPNFQIDPSTGRATVSGFKTRSTGILLKVTPHVNPEKEIVLDVRPEISEVGATFDTYASDVRFPRFTVQKAETHVRLKNGETLVIGGLVKRKTVMTDNRVPILGDIPVLGVLFTNRREQTDPQQDLLIFLTVNLIDEQRPAPKAVAQEVTP